MCRRCMIESIFCAVLNTPICILGIIAVILICHKNDTPNQESLEFGILEIFTDFYATLAICFSAYVSAAFSSKRLFFISFFII